MSFRFCVVRSRGAIAPHIMTDVADALAFIGYETLLLDLEAEGAYAVQTAEDACRAAKNIAARVKTFGATHALGYGLAGQIGIGGGPAGANTLFHELGLTEVMLFFDAPLNILEQIRQDAGAKHSVICCWDRSYLNVFQSLGFSQTFYLPLATNARVFRTCASGNSSVAAGGVVFVGSLEDAAPGDLPFPGGPALKAIQDCYVARKMATPALAYDILLEQVLAGLPDAERSRFQAFKGSPAFERFLFDTWRRADAEYRRSAVTYAARNGGVRVHGDSAWGALNAPGLDACDRVAYGSALASVYGAADINLNLTASHLREAVNQRVFDVPATGAFLLTDHRLDLEHLFEMDTEIVSFQSFDEMTDKLRFFRTHSDARQRIASAAHRRVLAEHTWDHRMRSLAAFLKSQ